MEPGHEDREYGRSCSSRNPLVLPQWSPVMKTGNTGRERSARGDGFLASMEPGHEDREYVAAAHFLIGFFAPQWSPVMKTGNTSKDLPPHRGREMPQWSPVMKTGNTSSAPVAMVPSVEPQWSPVMKTGNTGEENPIRGTRGHASMEPGHEDREYGSVGAVTAKELLSLNGARS